jgi:hypothetical protein
MLEMQRHEEVAMRPLMCLFGLHHWKTQHAEDGSSYEACSRCHRDKTPPPDMPYGPERMRRAGGNAGW